MLGSDSVPAFREATFLQECDTKLIKLPSQEIGGLIDQTDHGVCRASR